MFQFPGLPSHGLLFRPWMTTLFRVAGFPHSDTHGSLTVYVSPWRFAVCRVLLLLHMPRHPPYALLRLITRELFNLVSFNLTSVFFLFDYSEKLHICLFCVFRFSKNPLPQKLPGVISGNQTGASGALVVGTVHCCSHPLSSASVFTQL